MILTLPRMFTLDLQISIPVQSNSTFLLFIIKSFDDVINVPQFTFIVSSQLRSKLRLEIFKVVESMYKKLFFLCQNPDSSIFIRETSRDVIEALFDDKISVFIDVAFKSEQYKFLLQ